MPMRIIKFKLQRRMSTLGIDAHVAFPAAFFTSIGIVMSPFPIVKGNVMKTMIVKAMYRGLTEGLKVGV